MKKMISAALGAAVLLAALTGCSTSAPASSAAAAGSSSAAASSAAAADADYSNSTVVGKIVSISGSKVTVQVGTLSGADAVAGATQGGQSGQSGSGAPDAVGGATQSGQSSQSGSAVSRDTGAAVSGMAVTTAALGGDSAVVTVGGATQSGQSGQSGSGAPDAVGGATQSGESGESGRGPRGQAPSGTAPSGEAPSGAPQRPEQGAQTFTAGSETATFDLAAATLTDDDGETIKAEDLEVGDVLSLTVGADNTVTAAAEVDLGD